MWIKGHVYSSVTAKSRVVNIWVKDMMPTKKGQSQKRISQGS